MARLALTVKVSPGSYPALPLTALSADFALTPAGATFVEGFSFPWDNKTILIVKGGAAPQTISINSTAEGKSKRTGDITTYAVGAGLYSVLGPFEADGWRQVDGNVYGAASATDVSLCAIRLNN